MKRCIVSLCLLLVLRTGLSRADDDPVLPKTWDEPRPTYAKVVTDSEGKSLLVIYRSEVKRVTEVRAVTKLVREVRVVNGEQVTIEFPKTETMNVQVDIWLWKPALAALDDPRIKLVDLKGNELTPAAAAARLAKVSVITHAQQTPEPFFLQWSKPDALFLIGPAKAFVEAPSGLKEALPTTMTFVNPMLAKISTGADGRRVVAIRMLSATSVEEGGRFITKTRWDRTHVGLDDPQAKFTDLQGNLVLAEAVAARLAQWTPILQATEKPSPLYTDGVRADTLILAAPGSLLNSNIEDNKKEPNANPPKTNPPITKLPLPPLPPLPPLNPQPTPADPAPMNPPAQVQPKGEAVPEGAPPVAIVKKLLEVQWGPLGRSTKHVYNFKAIRFGPPLKEVVTVNGQGQFTGKVRYPVRVQCDIDVIFTDGTSRMETKHSTFHFFLDSFNEWSFRFIENN